MASFPRQKCPTLCRERACPADRASGDYFRPLRAKHGSPAAITAAAHKLARIHFAMLRDRRSFDPKLLGILNEKHLCRRQNALRNTPFLSVSNLFLSRTLHIEFLRRAAIGSDRGVPCVTPIRVSTVKSRFKNFSFRVHAALREQR